MNDQIKKLVDEQGTLWARVQEIAHQKDGLEAEDREEFDKANAQLDKIEADIGRLQGVEAREAAAVKEAAKMEDLPGLPGAPAIPSVDEAASSAEAYSAAFRQYALTGMEGLKTPERELMEKNMVSLEGRAQGVGSGAAGGFTVPTGFHDAIVSARAAFGGLRNAPVTVISTAGGGDLPIPADDDTGNVGELLSENSQAATQDVVFSQKILKAYVWSSKIVRVSFQLLQDSAFNMDAFLGKKLGERIGRSQAQFWIDGTGTNQPEGILTGVATTNAANATTLVYDDFINLEHAVDVAYRTAPGTGYLISDSALKATRLIKDGDLRPLWMPMAAAGFEGGFPATINGFGYTVDVNLPIVEALSTPIVFGDLSNYWIRDVVDIQMLRLTERYADFLQVGFLAFSRADGRKVDAGNDPFRAMKMAA